MHLQTVVKFSIEFPADREVQRILLELLNQMDGFDQTVNVKVSNNISTCSMTTRYFIYPIYYCFFFEVIMATNRADTLDPALLRPGRLDRKIEFPIPDRRQKRLIFSTITGQMNLSDEVDLEDCKLVFYGSTSGWDISGARHIENVGCRNPFFAKMHGDHHEKSEKCSKIRIMYLSFSNWRIKLRSEYCTHSLQLCNKIHTR